MRMVLNCLGIFLLLLTTISCSHTLNKPEWVFDKNGVHIHVKADNKLNLYNYKAHTLYVCFYQLEEFNAFDKLTEDSAGIRQLLDCRLFDDSVAAADSKVIHAGEDIVLAMDRAERAQYIAMVAGYSAMLTGERAVRRHKFQVKKRRKSFFKQIYQCEPCEMNIEVSLGAHQIEYSKIVPTDEEMCDDECK